MTEPDLTVDELSELSELLEDLRAVADGSDGCDDVECTVSEALFSREKPLAALAYRLRNLYLDRVRR